MKLLTQLRQRLRVRHYSRRTEDVYVAWVKRLVRAHGMRHPAELSEVQIGAFLTGLAVEGRVSASTQMQALSALMFFYREVLGRPVGHLDGLVPARKPRRLPVVLTRAEVRSVLGEMWGSPRLVAALLYGAGLRLLEGLALRVKDVDLRSAAGDGAGREGGPGSSHGVAGGGGAGAGGSPGEGAGDARPRSGAGGRLGGAARGVGAEVSGGVRGVGVAVGISGDAAVSRQGEWGAASAPPGPLGGAAGVSCGGPAGGAGEAGDVPQPAALIRDALVGGWVRHPDGAGVAGASGRVHHDDLQRLWWTTGDRAGIAPRSRQPVRRSRPACSG